MNHALLPTEADPRRSARKLDQNPMLTVDLRSGKPDDAVAEAVIASLSDRLRRVTGDFLRVDAGPLERL